MGFVPTMGDLHRGHLSLVGRCRELAEYVVISIYVNPLQFGPGEDFDSYPRDEDRDLALAERAGVDLAFLPSDRELYPGDTSVVVTPKRLADRLCGLSRPGHFEGVLTVVAKLFGIITPDVSIIGQKDFQQAVLIKRMVADLNLPVDIEVAPTVREEDGLAMSSRNAHLSESDRGYARRISRGLAEAVAAYRGGERDAGLLERRVTGALGTGEELRVEYVEVVSAKDLEPVARADADTVIAVAAHVGGTRLIDNIILDRPDPDLEKALHNWRA